MNTGRVRSSHCCHSDHGRRKKWRFIEAVFYAHIQVVIEGYSDTGGRPSLDGKDFICFSSWKEIFVEDIRGGEELNESVG